MSDIIKISEIKDKINWHFQQATQLQQALDLILKVGGAESPISVTNLIANNLKSSLTELIPQQQIKKTFAEVVKDILSDEEAPLSGNSIFNNYNHRTKRNLSYNAFSGQLSSLVKEGKIIKHTIAKNPVQSKYFYGLPTWFFNGKLKHEYEGKIRAV